MSQAQLSVALCDDDLSGLLAMESLLNATLRILRVDRKDVRVDTFTDASEAETHVYSENLNLLLTDLVWPGGGAGEWRSGLTIAEAAKAANPLTVVAVITAKPDQETSFRDAARRRGADFAFTWDEAFGEGKIQTAKDLAKRLAPALASAVPQIVGVEQTQVGLVGLDTVAFSEEDDAIQEQVVQSFLRYMSESLTVLQGAPLVRPVFVFTGDGVFLGLAGERGPRLALEVAVEAWRKFTHLARYRTRIAVHCGPVRIATLSSGHQQLLGHSVNWLFRAVNAAPDDGLLVTDEYYSSVLQAGREAVPGVRFVRREAEAKHGRLLVVWDVVSS